MSVIEKAHREESQAGARRLAAIAELVHRTVDEDDDRGWWACDPWANTAARVGAALSVSQRRASGQMRIAVALRDRLPSVAELFYRGIISARLISELTWRTSLVDDNALIAVIDAELAEAALRWGPLSERSLQTAIDAVIERHDPAAVRRAKEILRTRDLNFGATDDPLEVTAVWGRLSAADAAVLQRRITTMAAGVCAADPRSAGERRADALGAWGNGQAYLPCRCGLQECPAAGEQAVSNVVIRVIADQGAVDAARELIAAEDAERPPAESATAEAAEPTSAEPTPAGSKGSGVALLPERGVLPTVALAEAIRGGAKVTPLPTPGEDAEPRYRPSARLAEFVRLRDLFCRFPGCDVPADRCDIDHTVAWPVGPTHASNLKCLCRTNHLMKTFWGGAGGWRDAQLADGTVIWTAPDGRTYTTRPGSRLFFPDWNTTTADLPPPTSDQPSGAARSSMMPVRQRLRSADVAARIKAERALNISPQCSPR